MTAERKYFSGSSLEIALMQAARHHGLPPEEVAYRKIEKRHGFLKARKGVVIEVDPQSPRRTGVEPAVEVSEPTVEVTVPAAKDPSVDAEFAPATESIEEVSMDDAEGDRRDTGSLEELIDAARRGLEEIMSFARLDLEAEVREGDGELEIELSGADRDRLVEDRGNLLLSIQHLLPRLIRGYTGRSIPCHVDSQDFHARREVELRKLAEEAAQEVRDRQRPRTLPPMNPAERRIIHVTLAEDKQITTESQGKGFFKRVTVSPAMRRPRGFDRYSR